MKSKMISIVIPTCNRTDFLERCLSRLTYTEQGMDASAYEIIVTDDGSNEESKQLTATQFSDVHWVQGPRKGPAANRNNGAMKAQGQWLLFLDDDVIPDKNIIRQYRKAIEANPATLVFEGCTKVDRPQRHFLEESPVNETGGYLWSCNFMIGKELFSEKLKGFDEKFPSAAMEDVDLRYRLQQNKIPFVFVAAAFVVHPWRLLEGNLDLLIENRAKSYLYFMDKYPELKSDSNKGGNVKNEVRFYIKKILFNLIRFKGRGVFTYIRMHIKTTRFLKNSQRKELLQ